MLLELRDVRAGYGRITVLWDISLEVSEGGLVALIGANGAGKTTTIKAVIGLVQVSSGQILFRGKEITNQHPWRIVELGIGLVPEGARVFPELTVQENLLVGGIQINDKKTLWNRMEYVFQLFPVLEERKKQPAGTLSGGERQMLAIARALMNKPELLLVDEISMGLMPLLVQKVFETLVHLNKSGISILIAEQNVKDVLKIASFAYVIENGRIVLADYPQNLMVNERVKAVYLGL
jgi:branched-chain amino acid transport system ATP-binding protein